MNIYIDCEFNGFGGELISMALVAENGQEFYEVLEGNENPVPWVKEHVMPILNKDPIALDVFHYRLERFLAQFESINIVADWPEDLKWFCWAVIKGPGVRMIIPPLTLQFVPVNAPSKQPHNALADARGIAKMLKGFKC